MIFCLAYCSLSFSIQDNTYADPYGGYDHHARYIFQTNHQKMSNISQQLRRVKTAIAKRIISLWLNTSLCLGIMASEVEDLRSRAKFQLKMMFAGFSYSIYRYSSTIIWFNGLHSTLFSQSPLNSLNFWINILWQWHISHTVIAKVRSISIHSSKIIRIKTCTVVTPLQDATMPAAANTAGHALNHAHGRKLNGAYEEYKGGVQIIQMEI